MPPPPSAWRMSKTPREHQNSCPKRRTQTHPTVLNLVVMDQLREHFMRYSLLKLAAISVAALTLAACARNEAAQAPPPAPQVSVAQVLSRQVTEFEELTGRFEAVERVELRPRVSGYIASINFIQGREVKKGDVLLVIDPRPYEADLKRAKAQLAQARSEEHTSELQSLTNLVCRLLLEKK